MDFELGEPCDCSALTTADLRRPIEMSGRGVLTQEIHLIGELAAAYVQIRETDGKLALIKYNRDEKMYLFL